MSEIANLFSSRVPRYTSYPTAPHFHAGIGGEVYGRWLAELPQAMPLSLYIHVPFCDSLCWFCGCHTAVVNNYRPVSSYLDSLLNEIRLVAQTLKTRRKVTHIHWGGGSPTLLQPSDILRLDAVTRALFDVAPDAEFAVEIDPRGFGADTAEALAKAGVNRASIGIQDCDPKVQAAINRMQSKRETRDAVRLLRRLGIKRINLDLIYGLPYQTGAGIRRTLDFALSLKPDRLAVFGYAHVPQFKKHQALIPESALPGAAERISQELAIHATLLARGYRAIGLDHYALPGDPLSAAAESGRLARNFQGYTTDRAPALIGFGASSISRLPQGYVQNTVATPAWSAQIKNGTLAAARGVALSQDDRIRRHVIERLMCHLSVDLECVRNLFALPSGWFARELEKLKPLVERGLVSIAGETVSVTGQYRQAARLAAAAFDSYLERAPARHAMTA